MSSPAASEGGSAELWSRREEYFPYGRPSDRRDSRNRYRFIGVERDEETGMCMTGPRLYDPVSGRFLQGDAKATEKPGWVPFNYCLGAPIRRSDASGYEPSGEDDEGGVVVVNGRGRVATHEVEEPGIYGPGARDVAGRTDPPTFTAFGEPKEGLSGKWRLSGVEVQGVVNWGENVRTAADDSKGHDQLARAVDVYSEIQGGRITQENWRSAYDTMVRGSPAGDDLLSPWYTTEAGTVAHEGRHGRQSTRLGNRVAAEAERWLRHRDLGSDPSRVDAKAEVLLGLAEARASSRFRAIAARRRDRWERAAVRAGRSAEAAGIRALVGYAYSEGWVDRGEAHDLSRSLRHKMNSHVRE